MYFVRQLYVSFSMLCFNNFDEAVKDADLWSIERKNTDRPPSEQELRDAKWETTKLHDRMTERADEFKRRAQDLRWEKDDGRLKSTEGIKPLMSNDVKNILSGMPQEKGAMVISESVRADVMRSFEEKPLDTANMTEAGIREAVEARVVAAKVEELGTREIPSDGTHPSQTEADYIKWLEEKYGLNESSLEAIRARNQTGIGSEIDATGKITDPKAYKQEMETLAQNAKKAQEYMEANKDLLAAGNTTIYANAAAILEGQDPATLTDVERNNYGMEVSRDMSLGDGFSSFNRLMGTGMTGFDSTGSGVGNVNLDPGQLANLPPTNPEKAADLWKIFGSAISKYGAQYGIPAEWANDPNLHKVVMKESGGIVGRLNYCFGPVAKRMGKSIDDPQFITFVHQKLKAWATAGDFGIRSVATGIGQFIKANVEKYYPDKLNGINDADNECIGMLRYIKDRYGTPANVVAQYGKHHEGY